MIRNIISDIRQLDAFEEFIAIAGIVVFGGCMFFLGVGIR